MAIAEILRALQQANPDMFLLIQSSGGLEDARGKLFTHLDSLEKKFLYGHGQDVPAMERANAKQCIRVFKNLLSPLNERKADCSSLSLLRQAICERKAASECFVSEFEHLFKGIACTSGIYRGKAPDFLSMEGRDAAIARSDDLDKLVVEYDGYMKKYKSGLDIAVQATRKENKKRILAYFKATEKDWNDWHWQCRHVIKNAKTLTDLIAVPDELKSSVEIATSNRIPFGITPYYLSLMDKKASDYDDTVRAQVIPPLGNSRMMAAHRNDRGLEFDFMKEHETSPIDLVTRRYPLVAILKPMNTCPQICIYCQRNWEIEEAMAPCAMASKKKLKEALDWFKQHPTVKECLITGGDPGIMPDKALEHVIAELSKLDHMEKIRIATRVPVTLPQRVTDNWADIMARYHAPGKREVYVVTHFEHPYEITPEAMEAVQKLRTKGISVYNQEVFTTYNSRRFESVALRRALKLIGVDPYYTFVAKGKQETKDYLVPIARILQERKEEARLLPGSSRTDEPVFNVPGLGKNHVRAWQDHELIMIRDDGARVYEMHPWEKNISLTDPYLHVDVPITDYLQKMESRGEKREDYSTIWYYY